MPPVFAQGPTPPPSPITATTVVPTGTCSANAGRLVGPTGLIYTCQSGTWALSTTTGTVTSIATTGPITGGTITGTGTIACATCVTSASSLTSTAIMTGAGSQASQTGLIKLVNGILSPTSDSTTAIQFDKADGSTNIVTIDSTNARVGIGGVPISGITLTVVGTLAATTVIGLADSASAAPAQVTAQGSSNGNQELLIGYNTTSDFGSIQAIKQGTGGEPLKLNPAGGAVVVGISTTPASAAAAGVAGAITWDASFIYVCIAANTWKRVAIATW